VYFREIITGDGNYDDFTQQNNCVRNLADLLVSCGFVKAREFIWKQQQDGPEKFYDQICIDLSYSECSYQLRIRTMGSDGCQIGLITSESGDTDLPYYWNGIDLINMPFDFIYNDNGVFVRNIDAKGTEGFCYTTDGVNNIVWIQGAPFVDGIATQYETIIDYPAFYEANNGETFFLLPVHVLSKSTGEVISIPKNIYRFNDDSFSGVFLLQDNTGKKWGRIGNAWFRE